MENRTKYIIKRGGLITAAIGALTFAASLTADIIYENGKQNGREEVRQAVTSRLFNQAAAWKSRSEDSLLAERLGKDMQQTCRDRSLVLLDEARNLFNPNIDYYIEQNSPLSKDAIKEYGFSW